MRLLVIVLALTWVSSAVKAQFVDDAHKARWFHLQKVAVEVKELETCWFNDVGDGKKLRSLLEIKKEQLATSVEDFVSRYVQFRHEYETPSSFKYRVWAIALEVGHTRARTKESLDAQTCFLLGH